MAFLRRVLGGVVGRVRTGEDAALRSLPPPGKFHHMLERERARTDRTGDEFSLLTFGMRSWGAGRTTFTCLAELFEQRLRITDAAGWLNSRHLGVILPDTPGWGAWTVADELCMRLPHDALLPECRVFVYAPRDPSAAADGQHQGARFSMGPEARRSLEAMEELLFAKRLPVWKRALDIVGASVGLVLLWPVLLLAAVAIKLDSAGPVFFTQTRKGLGGRPFRMVKFRSMVTDAESRKRELLPLNEQDGPAFKLKSDPRTTAVGRWLRATSIDELPQLWNVLKGDMSLVGPRPLPCDESDACRGWHRRRLDVTPGLTCTWQVKGRSKVSFTQWMRMDAGYASSLSPWNDLKLLLRTVPAVLLGKNE